MHKHAHTQQKNIPGLSGLVSGLNKEKDILNYAYKQILFTQSTNHKSNIFTLRSVLKHWISHRL